MARKFRIGDYARPLYVQPYVDWLRLGRPIKVVAILPAKHGGHCYYRFSSRRGRPAPEIRSDRLRTLDQRYRAPRGTQRAEGKHNVVKDYGSLGTLQANGYYTVTLPNGVRRLRSHLVWEAVFGPLPHGHIVHHRNGDRADDSLENLQVATPREHGHLDAARRKGAETL